MSWFGGNKKDELIDGDNSPNVDATIKLNESAAQLTFAKIILGGALITFLVLTGFGVYFIYTDEDQKLQRLMNFTTSWFSPVWAIVGGVITYFFPHGKK